MEKVIFIPEQNLQTVKRRDASEGITPFCVRKILTHVTVKNDFVNSDCRDLSYMIQLQKSIFCAEYGAKKLCA